MKDNVVNINGIAYEEATINGQTAFVPVEEDNPEFTVSLTKRQADLIMDTLTVAFHSGDVEVTPPIMYSWSYGMYYAFSEKHKRLAMDAFEAIIFALESANIDVDEFNTNDIVVPIVEEEKND
jgi:hypothetical protein